MRVYAAGRTRLDGLPLVYAVSKQPDENLGEVIQERPLTNEEARVVLDALLSCVAYLHQHRLVHGHIAPRNIVAVGDRVKLTTDCISEAQADNGEGGVRTYSADMYGIGTTLVEILTQERYVPTADPLDENASIRRLASPFREIAVGCLQPDPSRRWTATHAMQALAGTNYYDDPVPNVRPVQQPSEPKRLNRAAFAYIGAVLVCLLGLVGYRLHSGRLVVVPEPSTPETAIAAPPPSREASREAASRPEKAPAPRPPERAPQVPAATANREVRPAETEGWAVVAAIYRDFDAAERRAQAIHRKWPQFKATVFPPKGEGRKYMVVLGSGMSKEQADRLRRQATSAGLPRDTYVTKLTSSAPLPTD
jgi:serine/threonine protein kinase